MSDVEVEVVRVQGALDRPTLQLLDQKWAAVALPIFACSFSQEVRSIRAERLHVQVDAYLAELRTAGYPVPTSNGKTLCIQWVRQQWLFREPSDDGQEQYRLTSHTQDALNIVEEMTRERSMLSGSRITTIMEAVSRVATNANPNRQERVDRLGEQIANLSTERDRLVSGGEVYAAPQGDVTSGFIEVLRHLDGLPVDFKRVEESVAAMHKTILRNLRDETRQIGEVLDDYLSKSRNLLKLTPEGQAFEGAFELLRNKDWLTRLRGDVDTILSHPYADTLLPEERKRMRGTVDMIRSGIDDVLSQRSRLSATLRERIENYDQIKNRELGSVLRSIDRELRVWMQVAKSRSAVEVELMPPSLDVEHLRLKMFDTDSERAPEPLVDVSADAPAPPSLAELRQQGGPSLNDLKMQLLAAVSSGEAGSVAEMFNDLPVELRRPVEILGLIHLLRGMDVSLSSAGERETVGAYRPNGSKRGFLMPNVTFAAVAAVKDGGTA